MHLPHTELAAAAPPLALLARGVLLGLGAAVPIGPVNVEIARRTLRDGFPAGFALGCGAVTVDILYAALSSLSFTQLLTAPAVARVVGAAGVVLLLYLAFLCFRAAAKAWRTDPIVAAATEPPAAAARPSAHSAYLAGVLMTLFNPMTLAFWFTVVPGQIPRADAGGAASAAGTGGLPALPVVCAGVFLGTISWVVAFAGLLGWAGRRRKRVWLAAADAVGGVILLVFGIVGLLRLIRSFI